MQALLTITLVVYDRTSLAGFLLFAWEIYMGIPEKIDYEF